MAAYILRRILLIVPTLLGIMIINFAIIQSAPGGPVEQAIARMEGQAVSATARLSGGAGGGGEVSSTQSSSQGSGTGGSGSGGLYRGSQGLPNELVEKIQIKYGFDKPWYERFYIMMGNYLTFDFGDSFFIGRPVVDVVVEKMPVSISLG
ncbi:MAG: microcin ABC transporter permease, partial [Pseudomonadota bacterium]